VKFQKILGTNTCSLIEGDNQARVIVPKTYEGMLVVEIAEKAFSDFKLIETISLPDEIKRIQGYAFSECSNLKKINIPKNVQVIPERCFCRCSSLKNIQLHDEIITIENGAFWGCGFKKLVLPIKLIEIEEESFTTSLLEEVILPPNLRQIRKGAFSYCYQLKKVNLPNSLEVIEKDAFKQSYDLIIEYLPNDFIVIDEDAFSDIIDMPKEIDPTYNNKSQSKELTKSSNGKNSDKKAKRINPKGPILTTKAKNNAQNKKVKTQKEKKLDAKKPSIKNIDKTDIADYLDSIILDIAKKTNFHELLEIKLADTSRSFLANKKEGKASEQDTIKTFITLVLLETKLNGHSKMLDIQDPKKESEYFFIASIYQAKLKYLSGLSLGKILKTPLLEILPTTFFPTFDYDNASLITDCDNPFLWGIIIIFIQIFFEFNDFYEILKSFPHEISDMQDHAYVYLNKAMTFGAVIFMNDDYKTITLSHQMFYFPPNEKEVRLIEYPNFVQKLIYNKIYTGKKLVFKP
jgi:hypothetical protein